MKGLRFGQSAGAETPYEIAAGWFYRVENGGLTSAAAQELARWIAESPENEAAWHQVQHTAALLAESAAVPGLMDMRAEALAYAKKPSDRMMFGMAAGVGLAALIAAFSWIAMHAERHPELQPTQEQAYASASGPDNGVFQTVVGERSTLTLADGSVVTLDTNSAIRVAYNDTSRTVYLERGQALFSVAKHKKIPFDVYAADRKITAVGTVFDVRLNGSPNAPVVSVALVEGKIKVSEAPSDGSEITRPQTINMVSGEALTARLRGPMDVHKDDTDRITSWRTGTLRFNDVSLSDAVAEMNRYSAKPIVIGEPALANLKISGAFEAGDTDHFMGTLAEVFPVRVVHDESGSSIIMRR